MHVGWGGVYFADGHTLEKEETESARGNTQSNIPGKLERQAWMASESSSYVPSLFQMLGGDQMHTGDLDKVQPPSTCYVTNEINLEPTVC